MIRLAVLALWGLCAPPPVLLPVGDSITDGSSFPGGYRVRLESLTGARFLGRRQSGVMLDPDHEGYSAKRLVDLDLGGGLTAPRVPAGGVPAWLAQQEAPTHILLLAGVNDLATGADVETSLRRLGTLLSRLRAAAPRSRLCVMGLLPTSAGWAHLEPSRQAFNDGARDVVLQRGAVWLPPPLVAGPDMHDGLHPALSGYDKLADAWHRGCVLP